MNASTRIPRLACALALAAVLPAHVHAQAHDAHAGHAMHAMPPTDAAKSDAVPPTTDSQLPKTPIPPITNEDREAAAQPAHAHDHGRTVFAFLMVDRLERWDDGDGGEAWGVKGWILSLIHI